MIQEIKNFHAVHEAKQKVMKELPQAWTPASEQVYQYAKRALVEQIFLWFAVLVGGILGYLFIPRLI
jgi:hypothetical protein